MSTWGAEIIHILTPSFYALKRDQASIVMPGPAFLFLTQQSGRVCNNTSIVPNSVNQILHLYLKKALKSSVCSGHRSIDINHHTLVQEPPLTGHYIRQCAVVEICLP